MAFFEKNAKNVLCKKKHFPSWKSSIFENVETQQRKEFLEIISVFVCVQKETKSNKKQVTK